MHSVLGTQKLADVNNHLRSILLVVLAIHLYFSKLQCLRLREVGDDVR